MKHGTESTPPRTIGRVIDDWKRASLARTLMRKMKARSLPELSRMADMLELQSGGPQRS
jgi:hypothetical protein